MIDPNVIKAVTELVQFVGYFLAIGAVGFRFGVVRRARGISDEAKDDEGSELTIRRSATMELTFAALVLIVTSVLVTLPSPK
jgi:putative copper export protein